MATNGSDLLVVQPLRLGDVAIYDKDVNNKRIVEPWPKMFSKYYGADYAGRITQGAIEENRSLKNVNEALKISSLFTSRVLKRMKVLLEEAERTQVKLKEIFKTVADIGYNVTSIRVVSESEVKIKDKRKRPKNAKFLLEAYRSPIKLKGTLFVRPASIRLFFACADRYFEAPVLTVKYFRNLKVYDHFLPALVKSRNFKVGELPRIVPAAEEADEGAIKF